MDALGTCTLLRGERDFCSPSLTAIPTSSGQDTAELFNMDGPGENHTK